MAPCMDISLYTTLIRFSDAKRSKNCEMWPKYPGYLEPSPNFPTTWSASARAQKKLEGTRQGRWGTRKWWAQRRGLGFQQTLGWREREEKIHPWSLTVRPLKSYLPSRKGSSSNHNFSGSMLNFGGGGGTFWLDGCWWRSFSPAPLHLIVTFLQNSQQAEGFEVLNITPGSK